jgi:hypothetical protein
MGEREQDGPGAGLEAMEVVTTGLPFCTFKAITGAHLMAIGAEVAGVALLSLSVVDTAMNLANLASLAVSGRRVVAACALGAVARRASRAADPAQREDLGNAADVALSFALVAGVVGLGQIPALPAFHLQVWNGAVVLNVLGAGLGRLHGAWQRAA